jgi:CO/xanthine dehydrogenase FAD-binding subunit
VVDVDADGRCRDPAIALFGVAGTPVRSRAAEQALAGQPPEPEVLDAASAVAFDGIEGLGDIHASSGYRRQAGQTLVRRGLAEATRQLAANRTGAAR